MTPPAPASRATRPWRRAVVVVVAGVLLGAGIAAVVTGSSAHGRRATPATRRATGTSAPPTTAPVPPTSVPAPPSRTDISLDHDQPPRGGVVDVTGFAHLSLATSSSGPVTVTASPAAASRLRAALRSLRTGPAPACMEDALVYEITFRPRAGAAATFQADGWECINAVTVSSGGKGLPVLTDRRCVLYHAVVAVLRGHEAGGTERGMCAAPSA